jgi:hypothetical protein
MNLLKNFSPEKTILMKVTSRERPQQLIDCVKKYIELAENPHKMVWLFTFDKDDNTAIDVMKETQAHIYISNYVGYLEQSSDKINAINRDINIFPLKWDILLNISDDQFPIVKGYDNLIRSSMPDDLDASLWFYDGHQRKINTQEIIGSKYYQRFNYIYYPEYRSFFCDNEAKEVADKLGKLRRFKECIIEHQHPGWSQKYASRRDDLYKRNDQHWKHDEDLYNYRKSINFGL